MDKDLTLRLRNLGLRFCSIGDYAFADRIGYSHEELERLAKRMKPELNFVLPNVPRDAEIDFQRFDSLGDSNLREWEERIDEITRRIQSDETYQRVLQAYNANNQEVIGQLMPSIFGFLPKLKKPKILYHGVTPRKTSIGDFLSDFDDEKPPVEEYITPDGYIDRMLRIQAEGLLPSLGEHQNTDENLRPVFTVPKHEETYGLMFFELDPMKNGYAVFVGTADEHLIYTPKLQIPMGLCLKSRWYAETDRIEVACNVDVNDDIQALVKYRDHLENRLRERRVPFTLVEPN